MSNRKLRLKHDLVSGKNTSLSDLEADDSPFAGLIVVFFTKEVNPIVDTHGEGIRQILARFRSW
jgi:hypothetical protein